MGLTNWRNSPKGQIRKRDVSIAKSYLSADELDGLNRIVTMYLDYAENQARKSIVMLMNDWVIKLNAFLQFNEEAVLLHQGKINHSVAKALAEEDLEKYRVKQDKLYESDFDKEIKRLTEK